MTAADIATIAATLTIYAAIVVSPGPSFALVSRMAAAGERRAAYGATFGLASAATIYAVLTMAGLSVILAEIDWLARAVQIAGGLYLIWLGIEGWRSAGRPLAAADGADESRFMPGFRRGFVMCLSNPKAIAFFVGLYAAAVPPETSLAAKLAILAGAYAIEVVWYGAVTLVLSQPQVRRVYERCRRIGERILGALLAAFGMRLLLER
ncbi:MULTISPECIES: LysE family translocator [unclassified Chelatococcus]|uniref:LysE family translocator n=1 Tax=unclassified Chelatococcus TaxID=2638111 RepID=UPI0003114D82|nr:MULTISPECIES: LysE family transporter [unclassified Chelatococcus]ALA18417.1 threonine transporter [Chelatococcus sp. CO-6]